MPNVGPILLLGGLAGAVALAASSASASAKQGSVTLDAHMPESLSEQVLHALATSQDPAELQGLAAQCDTLHFPLAAAALRARAAALKAAGAIGAAALATAAPVPPGGVPPAANAPDASPGTSSVPSTGLGALDANIDPQTGQAVLTALSTETDPAKLIGFAHSIQDQYPLAAAALMTKAAGLTAQQHATEAAHAADAGVLPTEATHATPAAAQTADTPPTAVPNVVKVPVPYPVAVPSVTPQGTGSWRIATDADVQADGTAPRYAALLSQSVGTNITEVHNGRTWQFRVISKTTDPGLTTYAKDVKGWIWVPSAPGAVPPVAKAPAANPVLVPVVTTATMANVPPSPTIKAVQHALNAAGASPPLAEDGLMGPKTTAAVKSYQAAHGLTVDGIPGPQTQASLGIGSAPVTQDFHVSPAQAATMPSDVAPVNYTLVSLKDVQHALNLLGASPPLVEDGINGPKTIAGVKQFQSTYNASSPPPTTPLAVDGAAGPLTKTAITSVLIAKYGPPDVTSASGAPYAWRAAE